VTPALRCLAIPLAGTWLAACGSEAPAPEAGLLPAVLAAPAVALDVAENIRASGEIQARNHITIAAEVSGRVTEIRVDEGGAVETGDIVLEIDPERRRLETDAARARAAQAAASQHEAQREAERVRSLHRQNVASQARLDEVETALRLARSKAAAGRAERGVAERALADASVSAPFGGLVARRHVGIGEFVQPGTKLFELVSLDPVEVVFHVPELDAARVSIGQSVSVSVAPYPEQKFEGRVIFVSPTIDPLTRTLRVKAELANTDGLLRPGLFARANLGIAMRRGLIMVPEEAIVQRAEGPVVFKIVDGNRVARTPVQTGSEHAGLVAVRGEIAAGERVVRRGHGGLADGAVVALRNADGGPAPTDVATRPAGETDL
jgi:membrane fusion protein (multidrug efflux system)